MKQLYRLLTCMFNEAYYVAYAFVRSRSHAGLSEEERFRRQLAETRVFLARRLRAYPWWVRGHLLLGSTELELAKFADVSFGERTRDVVSCSAQAVLQLAEEGFGDAEKLQREAEVLLASVK